MIAGVIKRQGDVGRGIKEESLGRIFASGDGLAHIFQITVSNGGVEQDLTGCSVQGYFIRSADDTVLITGSADGSVATVVLPAACYAVYGPFKLVIRVVNGNTRSTVYVASGYVTRSSTDTIIDPGHVIPDITELLAQIDAMRTATAAAEAAATKAVRYDSAQSLQEAEKGTARTNIDAVSSAELANVSDDVADLKSAIERSITNSVGMVVDRKLKFSYGYYNTPDIGEILPEKGTSTYYKTVLEECAPGEYVYIQAYGGSNARTYAILDANKAIIDRSGTNARITTGVVIPDGAAYIVINSDTNEVDPVAYICKYDLKNTKENVSLRFISETNNIEQIIFQPGYFPVRQNFPYKPYRLISSNNVVSAITACSQGDCYYVRLNGNALYNTVMIYDANYTIISSKGPNPIEEILYISADAAFITFNTLDDGNFFVRKLTTTKDIFELLTFESGGFNDSTGQKSSSYVQRIRNRYLIKLIGNDFRIVLPDGYSAYLYLFDSNMRYIGLGARWLKVITRNDTQDVEYINFAIRKDEAPNSDISADVDYITENIKCEDFNDSTTEIDTSRLKVLRPILNLYDDNVALKNRTIDQNGMVIPTSGFKVSEVIDIPQKYNKNKLYIHAFSEIGNAPIVLLISDDNVEVNTTASSAISTTGWNSIRVVFPSTATQCMVAITDEVESPRYVPYKLYSLSESDYFGYDRNVISDGAIDSAIRVGMMYYNDQRFGYGTEHTAFAEECILTTKDEHTSSSDYEGERYQIDCSTYVLLMIMGIKPECSRYLANRNTPAPYGYKFNGLAEYEGYVYGVPQTQDTKRLYANSIASYAYKNGYLFFVDKGFRNIRAGDIIFRCNQSQSYNFFEDIGHCMFVADVVPTDTEDNVIVVLEGTGGSSNPCRINVRRSVDENMIYAARLPLPYVHTMPRSIGKNDEDITVNVQGTSGTIVEALTLPLTERLVSNKVYTIVAKCDLPDNCYMRIKSNGAAYIGDERRFRRPDGYHVFRVFTSQSDTLTEYESITLQIVCTEAVSGTAVLSDVVVYDAYTTPTIM